MATASNQILLQQVGINELIIVDFDHKITSIRSSY